jgi:DNA-binding XRE family transcriptional regulator
MNTKQTGPALLAAYLAHPERTKVAAARDLGVSERCLYNWLNGRNGPNITLGVRIEEWSGGAVPLRSWVRA